MLMESDSCGCSGVGVYFYNIKKHLEKFHVFVFCCEGKILLTCFSDHIFLSGDGKEIANWRLSKKVYFRPWFISFSEAKTCFFFMCCYFVGQI